MRFTVDDFVDAIKPGDLVGLRSLPSDVFEYFSAAQVSADDSAPGSGGGGQENEGGRAGGEESADGSESGAATGGGGENEKSRVEDTEEAARRNGETVIGFLTADEFAEHLEEAVKRWGDMVASVVRNGDLALVAIFSYRQSRLGRMVLGRRLSDVEVRTLDVASKLIE